MTTICAECRWSRNGSSAKSRWRWLCAMAPRPQELDVVTGEMTAPYARCADLNRGECSEFEADKESEKTP